jgi:hypothetical protein
MAIRYFVFAEAVLEMIFLFDEFLNLVSKGNIGQKEAAVLLVVVIFGGMLIAWLGNGVRLKIVLKIKVHGVNKKSLKFI